MKKFLFRLVMLLIVTFAVQFITYAVLKLILDKSQFRFSRYFASPEHKFFVLGNSRAVNSVNEKFANDSLQMDIINLGFNGMPYRYTLAMLDDVNSKNTNAVIFFEITCLKTDDFDDSYSFYAANSKYVKDQYASTEYYWPTLLRLNNELFLRNIYYMRKSDKDWVNRTIITKNIIKQIGKDKPLQIFEHVNDFHSRLALLQQKCAARGNKLVFFLGPYYPKYLSKLLDYQTTVDYLHQNKKTYTFIDLNTIPLADQMFADRLHTNINGANVLTKSLLSVYKPN